MKIIKRISAVFCAFAAALTLGGCTGSDNNGCNSATNSSANNSISQNSNSGNNDQASSGDSKTLVAYFSCTGNTKKLAEYAAEVTGGTLYEIVPAEPYSSADLNYNDKNSRSTKEMNDKSCRPEISGKVDNFSDYEVVFIAYPIWWGEAPRIISTFLESYDFSGKTIVPFCTSGSSPMGSSANDLHSLASGAKWLDGARHSSSLSKSDMEKWINSLGI